MKLVAGVLVLMLVLAVAGCGGTSNAGGRTPDVLEYEAELPPGEVPWAIASNGQIVLLTAVGIVLNAGYELLPPGVETYHFRHDPPTTGSPGVRRLYLLELAESAAVQQPFTFWTAPQDSLRHGVIYIDEQGRAGSLAWSPWIAEVAH